MNPLKGPIGRLGYLAWSLVAWAPPLILAYAIDQTKTQHVGTYWLGLRVVVVAWFIGVILLSSIRRLQSIGWHPLLALLLLVPFVGLIFWVILLLVPPKRIRA